MKTSDQRILFKSEYALIAHSADVVELRSGVWNPRSLTLTDESSSGTLLAMLKELQSGSSPSEIASATGVSRSEVEALLDALLEAGVVSPVQTGVLNAILERQLSMPLIEDELSSPVVVFGDDELGSAIIRQISDGLDNSVTHLPSSHPLVEKIFTLDPLALSDGLERERVLDQFSVWKDSVVVFAMTEINPIAYKILDEIAQGVGFVWIHGAIDGPYVFAGPTIIPGQSASYKDLEMRFMMNARELASYQKYKEALEGGLLFKVKAPLAKPLTDLLASHLSMELVNWLKSGANFTINKIMGIYLPTMEMAYHEILPSPFDSPAASLQSRDATDLYFNVRDWLNAYSD